MYIPQGNIFRELPLREIASCLYFWRFTVWHCRRSGFCPELLYRFTFNLCQRTALS